MPQLFGPDDAFGLLAMVLFASALGLVGERKGWFGKVSGVIVTILLTAVLTTAGLIPSSSDPSLDVPFYQFTFDYLVPIAIPLLLFNTNLRRLWRETGRLLGVFLLGMLGVALGVAAGVWLVPLGPEGYKLAGVFGATYTGGAVNFLAVADALDFMRSPLFAAAVAIDNTFTILFILALFQLPGWAFFRRLFPFLPPSEKVAGPADEPAPERRGGPLMEEIALVLFIAAAVCALGVWLAGPIAAWLGTSVKLDLLLVTLFVVVLSNTFPGMMVRLEKTAFQLGYFLLYPFLAVIGAGVNLLDLLSAAPALLAFVTVALLVHFALLLLACRFWKFSLEELAIASCANVGGSTVAAPMAASFGMQQAITPAILVGVLGNVLGTFLGVGIGLFLQ